MKKNTENLDTLLKSALHYDDVPNTVLIDEVKDRINKEETKLNIKHIKRPFSIAAAVCCAAVLLTTTVFAAYYFLSPAQVANEFENTKLAAAFESDDAVIINQTQSQNGYDVSLLGIVSGAGLTDFEEGIEKSKTYAVVAIASQDGPMPDISDEDYDSVPFLVSPLVHGVKPWHFNIFHMDGGYRCFVSDGVMYRLIEWDDMEMFADYGLSLVVSSTTFYSQEAFEYDEETGLVTPRGDFDGVNLIFDLPVDPSKADSEKAAAYLESILPKEDGEDMPADEEIPIEIDLMPIHLTEPITSLIE